MFELFMIGGTFGMSVLTIGLITIFIAAWKAPRWVGNIGIVTLCFAIFYTFLGLYQAFSVLELSPDISAGLVYGGIRVALIAILYGLLIFIVSQVIVVIQKPRM